MNILSRKPEIPVFHGLEFEFGQAQGIEFDVEVAQELAERVAQADGGIRNHNHASSFQRVYVEIEGISEPIEVDEERRYGRKIVLPSNVLVDPNPTFARQFQGALDEREHSNRMNIPASIGMFTLMSAIPSGLMAIAFSEKGLTSEEALASVGIGVAISATLFGYPAVQNLYRRIVTDEDNRRIHQAHLNRASRLAAKLELPPVVLAK